MDIDRDDNIFMEVLGVNLQKEIEEEYTIHDINDNYVINENEEIKVWFYGNPESNKLVLERYYNIEFLSQYPDYEKFVNNYPTDEEYLALQIHPNAWDGEGFNQFDLIIDFLMEQKVAFITPYQLYRLAQP